MDPLHRTQADPAQARSRPSTDAANELRQLGNYRLLRRLGEGGMGSVFLAYHEATDRHVALKVLSEQLASNQAYVDRFYREARSGAVLNHPSVVRSLGAGKDPTTGKHFLVLEYVDGPSAQGLLEQFGRLSVGDAVHVALDIARALEHAHSRKVIHRDIKPDNILITRSGVAKLADLGLAKRTDEVSSLTAAEQGFGTPYYMPYEQAVNAKSADGRSDIYALGATLYHLLTGDVPFKGDSPLDIVDAKDKGDFTPASERNETVPRVLDQCLAKMLARLPADRYQTASELIVDLERSRLAAPVPSFADPELALKDPWVRACLATSAQPTLPDLGRSGVQTPSGKKETPLPPDQWIVRYRGREGSWKRVRLNVDQLRQALRDGKVPQDAEACADPRVGFQMLSAFPELKSLIAGKTHHRKHEAKKEDGAGRVLWGPMALCAAIALLLGLMMLIYLFVIAP